MHLSPPLLMRAAEPAERLLPLSSRQTTPRGLNFIRRGTWPLLVRLACSAKLAMGGLGVSLDESFRLFDRLNRAFAGAPAEMADTAPDKVDPAGTAANE